MDRLAPGDINMTTNMPDDLLIGYHRFRANRYAREVERYHMLAEGQSPKTMIIGCADSRVDPSTIFSAGPGELFIVRNVAALVPPYGEATGYHGTSAALEFAIIVLGISNLVVMGHSSCGGVAAALAARDAKPVGRYIGPWVALLNDTRDALLAANPDASDQDLQDALERRAVECSINNLMTFPFVSEAVAEGRVRMDGALFSIIAGELIWRDPDSGEFSRVPES